MTGEKSGKEASRRITLTVDAESYSPATIDIAVAMAASMNATLRGLFFENADLLRMADLPCSMEITYPTAQQRALDKHSLQQTLRQLGAQARNYLARAAKRSHVEWSFGTMPGKGAEAGLGEADESELLIIGQASRHHAHALPEPYTVRILLIDDYSPALLATLKVILEQMQTAMVDVVMIGETRGESSGNIGQQLPDTPNITVTRLESNDIRQMINMVAMSPDYVIISRKHPFAMIRQIVHESGCPVILVT